MSVLKWFVPRPARRVLYPLYTVKHRVTPRPVRKLFYARHPWGTFTSAATRRAFGYGRRRSR